MMMAICLKGWAACMGSLDYRAGVLAAFLYAWQFPHFNALSWNLRSDYSKAGYRMMVVTDPALNARVALRYAIVTDPSLSWFSFPHFPPLSPFQSFIPLCLAIPFLDMTTWWFAADSTALNLFLMQVSAVFLFSLLSHSPAPPSSATGAGISIRSLTNRLPETSSLPRSSTSPWFAFLFLFLFCSEWPADTL